MLLRTPPEANSNTVRYLTLWLDGLYDYANEVSTALNSLKAKALRVCGAKKHA